MESASDPTAAVDPPPSPSHGEISNPTENSPPPSMDEPPDSLSSYLPPTRPPYIPQFTAATQMILKRMKGESNTLGGPSTSPLSTHSLTPRPEIASSTYEDVKRRLVMGMTTSASMTMEMPAPAPVPTTSVSAPQTPSITSPALAPAPGAQPALAPKPLPPVSTVRKPPRKSGGASGMSAIRRVSSGLSASGRKLKPQPTARRRLAATATPTPTTAGAKRKRGTVSLGGNTTSGALSTPPDTSNGDRGAKPKSTSKTALPPPPPPPPTKTKSGRYVQKPSTYNPAAAEAAGSRRRAQQAGKVRTAEQALCKKCTRMHSPASNQMVFCDGCNDGWHQMCHEPWVDDALVRDPDRAWFCGSCQQQRQQRQTATAAAAPPKRQRTAAHGSPSSSSSRRESWAGRTAQQKRAYLSTLPRQELVGLLMHSLDVHPDLPIFPYTGGSFSSPSSSAATVEGGGSRASPRGEQQSPSNGPLSQVRKASANGGRSSPGKGRAGVQKGQKENVLLKEEEVRQQQQQQSKRQQKQQQEQQDGDEDFDPLDPPWPKAGKGLYSLLPPEEDDKALVGDGDYEAFSVIIYDENGKKIEENGIRV